MALSQPSQKRQTETVSTTLPAVLENIPLEQLELAIRQRNGAERLAELQKSGISSFKSAISEVNTVEELYKVASSFVSKVNNIRASMKDPSEKKKRGRKSDK